MTCTPAQAVYTALKCLIPPAKAVVTTVHPAVVQASTLPFTGLDLAVTGGAGAALVIIGVSLRRVTKPNREV